jgi:prephenate dehydrogenase
VKVAVIGTGLIGGSLGLALRRLPAVSHVAAYDRDPAVRARAVERGAADSAAGSEAEAVTDAELVFVATPVGAIAEAVKRCLPGLSAGAIVTDVGSTKSQVVLDVEQSFPEGSAFIGGHPMAGTEEEGIEAAAASLFEGAWWILTPTERVDPSSYQRLHSVLTAIGAQVLAMDPAQHDELLAVISHLPHLTATALMTLAAERGREHAALLALAAGGFRDVTRVAASNPEIWIDICRENRPAIARALDVFAQRLGRIRDLVESGDASELRKLFLEARESRRNLPGKSLEGAIVEIQVPVPDKPGVLAEVTMLIGNLGINIENLEISHSAEGGRGTLHLTIVGRTNAQAVAKDLELRGYEPKTTLI